MNKQYCNDLVMHIERVRALGRLSAVTSAALECDGGLYRIKVVYRLPQGGESAAYLCSKAGAVRIFKSADAAVRMAQKITEAAALPYLLLTFKKEKND